MGKNYEDSVVKELKIKKEFTAPISDLNDGKKWYKTWNGEVLIAGNIYKINNEFCVYAGDFKSISEAPNTFCCFTIGDTIRVRHLRINSQSELPIKERHRKTDDTRPIDTTAKDTDNTLMLLIKASLQYKNINRGDFRKLYPNISDMNNILRCIESGDNLSWARFTDLIGKLDGITYGLEIYADNKVIIKA
jgi:hypothetical protein